MKDVKTGKIYLSRRTIEELGPDFARAGHDIRRLYDEAAIMNAFLDTLSHDVLRKLKEEMDRRASLTGLDSPGTSASGPSDGR